MFNAYCRRPWSIRCGHLVLKQWNPSLTWQEVPFTTSTLWVQVHGLPELWRSPENLRLIGGKVGSVVEVDLAGDEGGTWKRFIRIQIEVELHRPLLPGIFLPRNDLPHLWISLRYEKMANVCYRCGVIGHETHACQGKAFLIWNPFGHEFIALGPWLRAENSTTLAELYHNPGNVTQPAETTVNSPNTAKSQTNSPTHQVTSSNKDDVHAPCPRTVPQENSTNGAVQYQTAHQKEGTPVGPNKQQLAVTPTHIGNPSLILYEPILDLTENNPSQISTNTDEFDPSPISTNMDELSPLYPPGFGSQVTSSNQFELNITNTNHTQVNAPYPQLKTSQPHSLQNTPEKPSKPQPPQTVPPQPSLEKSSNLNPTLKRKVPR